MYQVLVAQSNHLFKIDRCIHRGMEIFFAFDSADCLLQMKQKSFDALILKYELKQTEDVSVYELLSEADQMKISTFFVSSEMEEEVLQMLFQFEISHYFLEPVSFHELFQSIIEVKTHHENVFLTKRIAELLHTLGIPNSVQGFSYIQEAITNCYYHDDYKRGVTKYLYPLLALQHHTTASAVEKSIRHAIELAFKHCEQTLLYDFFKGTIRMDKAKATNSQFISMCVDYLKNEEL
ncbi:MAG: sporulation initiation factor Spo0A C-terminal domain-containing protein [Erysipelotrichaceae bacterium]|nr:sporulation initiation factor Spo0A C-terminal domain-containing protein [Erysipelotrichaceae bacterium]